MIKEDGTVIHFNNPKVQASLTASTFAITGHGETKKLTDMVPGILTQLRADNLSSLKNLAPSSNTGDAVAPEDEEVPELVGNFDENAKEE